METLVLDTSYRPLMRVSWQRAITLLFLNKIEIIEEYEDREVRSVTVSIKMPSVIRFLRSIRRKKKAVKFSRENVYARDKGSCQYCKKRVTRSEATYDHVLPRSKGGKTTWENIVIACVPCNQKKGGRLPGPAGMKLATKPVKPKKLPDVRLTMFWSRGMPPSWKTWLRSYSYWNGSLEEDT